MEWCNIFALVPKLNGKVKLCLDPTKLNQVVIWPVHGGPILIDIFTKLTNMKYLSLRDANSGYPTLRLDEQLLYLTVFACQYGRYRCKWIPFEVTLAGNMFQRKTDKILKVPPNVSGIADDIFVVGYNDDGRDHDNTLQRVLLICRKVNLRLHKDKHCFRCSTVPPCGKMLSKHSVRPDPRTLKAFTGMPAKYKKGVTCIPLEEVIE